MNFFFCGFPKTDAYLCWHVNTGDILHNNNAHFIITYWNTVHVYTGFCRGLPPIQYNDRLRYKYVCAICMHVGCFLSFVNISHYIKLHSLCPSVCSFFHQSIQSYTAQGLMNTSVKVTIEKVTIRLGYNWRSVEVTIREGYSWRSEKVTIREGYSWWSEKVTADEVWRLQKKKVTMREGDLK